MQGNEIWISIIVAVIAAGGTIFAQRLTADSSTESAQINNYGDLAHQLAEMIDKNAELNEQIIQLRQELTESNQQIIKLNELVERLTKEEENIHEN
ncbi:hypothetical protein [Paucilactobacillus sp. N302-9]